MIGSTGVWLCAFSTLTLASVFGARGVDAAPDPANYYVPRSYYVPPESWLSEKAMVGYLSPVLKPAGKAARVYYAVNCGADVNYPFFPKIEVEPASNGESVLASVRSIFAKSRDVTVTEDKSGIVRIRIGRPPETILHTRIPVLEFGKFGQYNPPFALDAIETTDAVQAEMLRLKVRAPSKPIDMLLEQPMDGVPHLPASTSNVTMDEALDEVATVFKGIVFYGACTNLSVFDINFTGTDVLPQ